MSHRWNSMRTMFPVFFGFIVLTLVSQSPAFNPPVDESSGFSARIHMAERVQINGLPVSASVEIGNHNPNPATATIRVQGIDGWKTAPMSGGYPLSIHLAANSSAVITYQVEPATDSYSAHYPLHAFVKIETATEEIDLHPIAVLETEASDRRAKDWGTAIGQVKAEEPFLLTRQKRFSFEIFPDRGEPRIMPPGWTGMDSETNGIVSVHPFVHRLPKPKPGLGIHPPWKGGPGKARVVWTLDLPESEPITLGASLAIRDTQPEEPKSDGVTFRVLADDSVLFEEHTDTKEWKDIRVDLSAFAGEKIRLALESDVGPARDSTCDQSYWGEPWVYAGPIPAVSEQGEKRQGTSGRMERARSLLVETLQAAAPDPERGQSTDQIKGRVFSFGKKEGFGFAIVPGPHGILDAVCAVGSARDCVSFAGFPLRLVDTDPLEFLSGFQVGTTIAEGNGYRTELLKEGKKHWVSMAVIDREEGVELVWDSDLRITDLTTGRFDREASEIYAGVGNVIRDPLAPFDLHADGHQLATRHIGLRFGDSLNLLVACSKPPDKLSVNPSSREYCLHSHLAGSFYLVPSTESAFDTVTKYRRVANFPKAPGVQQLAGRFTFDLWWGSYRATADRLEMAAKYGLTDSVVVFHNWQRWGYDYRLPDISPPNPQFGTLEDFKHLRDICGRHGMLFAPHDNYIDFYPDAEGFSYDHICFDSSGSPIKGWMNFGRGAQAYRFRPDTYLPFLERNASLLEESVAPDAYFVDVFSSIGAFDYRDREGGFHSAAETVKHWGNGFDRIREILGGGAVQISESGTDLLLGHLDGAQCNHLRITKEGGAFSWKVDCEDHERIPWQDLAMHEAFVLQGAGYPHRFISGQDPYLHGINSDDYLSAEVLTGHAPMTDEAFSRAVVRKYWLLHGLLEEVAGIPMREAEFVDGDIHRQTVEYENGAKVWVNRGKEDWAIEGGHVLPRYGFWAEGQKTHAGVVKIAGDTVEFSKEPDVYYADARGVDCQPLAPLKVSLAEFTPTDKGNNEYSMTLDWVALGEIPEGYVPFVHFTVPGPYGYDKTVFQAKTDTPNLSDFSAPQFRQEWTVQVPKSVEERTHTIRVGIWDPNTGKRRMPSSKRGPFGNVPVGTIQITDGGRNVQCHILDTEPEWESTPPLEPVDFGWCKTMVGIRAKKEREQVLITPLPDGVGAPFHLNLSFFDLPTNTNVSGERFNGEIVAVESECEDGFLIWDLDPQFFRYRAVASIR